MCMCLFCYISSLLFVPCVDIYHRQIYLNFPPLFDSVNAVSWQIWANYRASFGRGLTCTGENTKTVSASLHVPLLPGITVISSNQKH